MQSTGFLLRNLANQALEQPLLALQQLEQAQGHGDIGTGRPALCRQRDREGDSYTGTNSLLKPSSSSEHTISAPARFSDGGASPAAPPPTDLTQYIQYVYIYIYIYIYIYTCTYLLFKSQAIFDRPVTWMCCRKPLLQALRDFCLA